MRWLLRKFNICPNAYYNFLKNRKSAYRAQKQRVLKEITTIYHEHNGVDGYRSMQIFLKRKHVHLSALTVHHYMNKELNLHAIVRRKKPNYQKGTVHKVFDNLQENVVGTSLSGKNVMLDSAGSIQTEATQIAADHNIRFEAKEIKIDAAAQKNHEQYEKQVTNAGLMTNGLGIMVGKQKRKDEDDDRYITSKERQLLQTGK